MREPVIYEENASLKVCSPQNYKRTSLWRAFVSGDGGGNDDDDNETDEIFGSGNGSGSGGESGGDGDATTETSNCVRSRFITCGVARRDYKISLPDIQVNHAGNKQRTIEDAHLR